MKIGVAISGCDIGGAAAYAALNEIENQGYNIAAVSCCSIAALSSALFSLKFDEKKCEEIMQGFLNCVSKNDTEAAIIKTSKQLTTCEDKKNGLIINTADITTGAAVLFTDDFYTQTKNFITLGTGDYTSALLSAAAPFGALPAYSYSGYLLCDYSLKYGSPVMTLKYLGLKKILSINFSTALPSNTYELAQNSMMTLNSNKHDIYIDISSKQKSSCITDYANAAKQAIAENATAMADKLLF